MKNILLLICTCLLSTACLYETSNSGDEGIYGGDPAFAAAKAVISTNCGNCHGDWLNYSEAEMIADGLIVAGDPVSSSMVYRLNGSTPPSLDGNPKNMPLGGGALSTDDIAIIETWISGVTP